MGKTLDLVGKKYNHLFVLSEAPHRYTSSGNSIRTWYCKCDCGKVIRIDTSNLTSGHIKQCKECGIIERAKKRRTHGKCKTHLYKIWSEIHSRCYNKNRNYYSLYGGKGIKMCDEWIGQHGFENFEKWAFENGYNPDVNARLECSIDRIDYNGDYSPNNCRWVSAKVQSNNKSNNINVIDDDGEVLTIAQLAEKHNIHYRTVLSRWNRGKREIKDLVNPYNYYNKNIMVKKFKKTS